MVLSAQDILKHYSFLYRGVLNMAAYAAAVEHSDCSPAVLDEMGVAARVSDFKQRAGRRQPMPPVNMPEDESLHRTPIMPSAPEKKTRKPAPTRRTERLPGEPKPRKAAGKTERLQPEAPQKREEQAFPPDLSDACRRVFALIPEDRAVSSDVLMGAGILPSELTVALTQLELAGLIEGLPGSLYIRTATR